MDDQERPGTGGGPRRRVFVHVGAPKTGSTGLQDTLWRNRGVLAEHGVHYPADRFDEHFLAALDLQQLTWGGLEEQATGAVERLIERANASDGTVILSHEVFAAASAEQVARLLSALDGEVHVVFSARDLARQVPAEWQEQVKHRHPLTYGQFLTDLTADTSTRPETRWFWAVQRWPDVLERWGATVPPERVHVVTVPQRGVSRDVLTGRFWALFGIDPDLLAEESPRANTGLDTAAAAALRRLDERLPVERLDSRHYRPLVREAIVHTGMGGRAGQPRVLLPPGCLGWAEQLTEQWLDRVRQSGYDVVGDLHELVPRAAADWSDPDDVPTRELLAATEDMLDLSVLDAAARFDLLEAVRAERDAALDEVRGLTDELARLGDEATQLRGEVQAGELEVRRVCAERDAAREWSAELVWLREHPVGDVKRRVVDASATSRSVRSVLDVYRAARDRYQRREPSGE